MRSLGELYQHESAAQYIFDRGVTWLTGYAIPEDQARAFLGMCKEQSGINRLLDALVVSILAAPVQPKPYLMQVLANQPRALDLYWEPDEAQVTDLQGTPLEPPPGGGGPRRRPSRRSRRVAAVPGPLPRSRPRG